MKESVHILFIHRNSKEMDRAVTFLGGRGFTVSAVAPPSNRRSIFREFDLHKTDVIILDGHLPRSDIFGFLKHLHSMHSTSCVLLIGTISNVNDTAAFLRAGIFDILTTPLTLNSLERVIRQGLRNREKLNHILQLSARLDSAYQLLEKDRDRLQKWSEHLQRLYVLNQTLSESLNIDEVAQSLAANLRKVIQYDMACLFLKNENRVRVYTHLQKSPTFMEKVATETFENRRSLLEKGIPPSGPIVLMGGTEILVPLRVATEEIGFLRLIRYSNDLFDDYQSRILAMISVSLSLAVRNAEIHREVQALASKDDLTSLLNRRAFLSVVHQEFRRAVRHETSLALILIDIDRFKKINDSYGHLVGDSVIREIGEIIKKSVREIDIVARYGGDELVVVLPKTNLEEAMVAAQRIRKKISTAWFKSGDRPIQITISMGVAQSPASLLRTPDDLFRLADQALYIAKRKGRNRIEIPPRSHVTSGQGVLK